jgi:YidC/Oxa1 family membrane protein insertase
MNFGFFKIISQALLNFLNVLHGLVKNYGFAIILLTACVKAVLWPLQNKANKSMRHMAALAPKMQALKEKYKDDPTRMNQEVMKLYKEHGVNPVGGCLPMMIQIPIFFGLFSMLGQAASCGTRRSSGCRICRSRTLFSPSQAWAGFRSSVSRDRAADQRPADPDGRFKRLADEDDAEHR